MSRENPLERQCDRQFAQQDDVNRLGRHCRRSASGDQLCCHGRPHIGANGVSWPPWKNGWKIKKAITCEKEHFSVLQNAPFRSQIFTIFFAPGGKGALTPRNQNSADVLVCCLMFPMHVRWIRSTDLKSTSIYRSSRSGLHWDDLLCQMVAQIEDIHCSRNRIQARRGEYRWRFCVYR